jgi:hypothetical protein
MDLRSITIISGGQTGVDRAALDFAIEHGFAHGGWCPRGRLAEDGAIPEKYLLTETPSRRYAQRTEWNVRDSDATVVFSTASQPFGGTALTLEFARRLGKPCLHLSRDEVDTSLDSASAVTKSAKRLLEFLTQRSVQRLNIAGPRLSQEPDAAEFASQVLRAALSFSDSQ